MLNYFGSWPTVRCRQILIFNSFSCEGNVTMSIWQDVGKKKTWKLYGNVRTYYTENSLKYTVNWFAVKSTKLWVPLMFLECYCAARKKSIMGDKIAARNNNVFCFWVCGTASWLCCDCSLHNNDIWNILSVHSFVGLTKNYFFYHWLQ